MGRDDKYEELTEVRRAAGRPSRLRSRTEDCKRLKQERDNLYDRLLRKQAEFENYKKRVEREKSEFMQFASAELMKELLNALDSFDLAIRNAETGSENMLRGFELIYKQLQDTLGAIRSEADRSERARPSIRISIRLSRRQPTDEVEENTVVEEMRKGYMLNGRLLRPAMVSVATKRIIQVERKTGLLRSSGRFAKRVRSGNQERLSQTGAAIPSRSQSGQ